MISVCSAIQGLLEVKLLLLVVVVELLLLLQLLLVEEGELLQEEELLQCSCQLQGLKGLISGALCTFSALLSPPPVLTYTPSSY